MNDQDLTSGLQDFFAQDESTTSGTSNVVGGIGAWILHLVVFAFAIYSGYHGISATARYHASGGLGMAAGIIGILVIEVVLVGLYLAYFNRRITGDKQKLAAAATAGLGFILSCLGIIGDSQMQAGMEVSNWLSAYLTWGLPIAPAFMALGAAVVMATEPKHLRLMAAAVQDETYQEKRHTSRMAAKSAELTAAEQVANMQLNGKMQTARYLLAAYRSPDVQAHIQASALANMPELMRAIGVDLPYGTVIEGQTIEPPPAPVEPPPAAEPPARPSWRDRLLGRAAPTEPAAPTPQTDPAVQALIDAINRGDVTIDATGKITYGANVGNPTHNEAQPAHVTQPEPAQPTPNGARPNG